MFIREHRKVHGNCCGLLYFETTGDTKLEKEKNME